MAEHILADWHFWARPDQIAPEGDWRVWMILAGRGFGKTRAGAEWVRGIAEQDGRARIALVAASLAEARSIMVEGDSGLLALGGSETDRPEWEPSLRRLRWSSGAVASLYSAAEPDSLRGPQHSHAWCDEIAKWDGSGQKALAAWDNLEMGLRLGIKPRIVATTTPRSVPLVQQLVRSERDIAITRGRTRANAVQLPRAFLGAMESLYRGSTLGRQELEGELLEDMDGALWTRSLIERCRAALSLDRDRLVRVVIGVDPPASSQGDACGIVVAARQSDGRALVLADCSVERPSPERWAQAVAAASRAWQADRIIAEANQGGDMVRTVLRAAQINLPVRLVHASRGKSARAEPVAALYETGRVRHANVFPALEDEMCGLLTGGDYAGPGRSPDRADALVWALTELMLGGGAEPAIRSWKG